MPPSDLPPPSCSSPGGLLLSREPARTRWFSPRFCLGRSRGHLLQLWPPGYGLEQVSGPRPGELPRKTAPCNEQLRRVGPNRRAGRFKARAASSWAANSNEKGGGSLACCLFALSAATRQIPKSVQAPPGSGSGSRRARPSSRPRAGLALGVMQPGNFLFSIQPPTADFRQGLLAGWPAGARETRRTFGDCKQGERPIAVQCQAHHRPQHWPAQVWAGHADPGGHLSTLRRILGHPKVRTLAGVWLELESGCAP